MHETCITSTLGAHYACLVQGGALMAMLCGDGMWGVSGLGSVLVATGTAECQRAYKIH
jgi:hypothetical protein